MNRRALILLTLMPLAGCAGGGTTTSPTPVSLSGNWQIQTGSAITPTVPGGILLAGSLQFGSAPQVTGTLTVAAPCITQGPLSFTGVVDSSGNLTLATSPEPEVEVQIAIPANAAQLATGTVASTGQTCNVALSEPGVAAQITALSGTYTGSVTSTATSGSTTGTVSMALTQSSTANTSGQFPVTGTLTYTAGSCTEAVPVTGTIGGVGINLSSAATPLTGQNYVSFAGSTTQPATQITASAIQFQPTPCSASASSTATYTGTLTQ
jgi:hypothetical protein